MALTGEWLPGVPIEIDTPPSDGMLVAYDAATKTWKSIALNAFLGKSDLNRALLKKASNVGTKVENGVSVSLANATGRTVQDVLTVEQNFDAIRVIFSNAAPVGVCTVGPVKVCSVADISVDVNQNGATWTDVTFSGAATVVLPNPTDAANPTVVFSDWIPLTAVARVNDPTGKNLPLILVRAYFPATTNPMTITGPQLSAVGTDTIPDGRLYIGRQQAGVDGVSVLANFTTNFNGTTHGCLGVQYSARGQIVQLHCFGDSLTADIHAPIWCDSWPHKLRALLSSSFSSPVEVANWGWSGQTSTQFSGRATYLLPQLNPGIVLYEPQSPNDGATLTAAIIATQRTNLQAVLRAVNDNFHVPVLWTPIPWSNNPATTIAGGGPYAAGAHTFTPGAMTNIVNGAQIRLGLNPDDEVVIASNVTATTFDCVTTKAHTVPFACIALKNTSCTYLATDSFRQAFKRELLGMNSTILVIDTALFGNGLAQELWFDILDSYEGLHFSGQGGTKMASLVYSAIANYVNQNR